MKDFLGCRIDYSLHSFAPRLETDFWVGQEIEKINFRIKPIIKILDMFSGTGCIGLAILKNIKNSQVDFVDIWPAATDQIRLNLELNKEVNNRFNIYRSNLFEKIKDKKYDFIFANPPYVALDRISEVQEDVLKNEPKVALFAGQDGLIIIRKFLEQVKNHLLAGGKLFMEFDSLQAREIKKILARQGFLVIFKKDQFNKIRWLEAYLN